jgi:ketosteroid isomerase-like protein
VAKGLYKRVLQQYIAATNTHDFTNVRNILHEQAVYWFTDKTCSSMQEIQNYFETAWDTIREEVYSTRNVQWLTVCQNSATCIYTYHYKGIKNGEIVSGSGRATNVFVENEKGAWRLIHEHLSSL